jgi:hypothetical protein
MKPEDAEEELPEGIEHFDEEVPPESYVWREIRQKEAHTVSGPQKFP